MYKTNSWNLFSTFLHLGRNRLRYLFVFIKKSAGLFLFIKATFSYLLHTECQVIDRVDFIKYTEYQISLRSNYDMIRYADKTYPYCISS